MGEPAASEPDRPMGTAGATSAMWSIGTAKVQLDWAAHGGRSAEKHMRMRERLLTALLLVACLLGTELVGSAPPAVAAGGGIVDLTGAVPATFTVTPGVEQLTITGGPSHAPLTLVDSATLERIVTLYTDNAGQLVVQYVPNNFLVFDPQTQGVLPTEDGTTLRPGTYRIVSEGVPGQPFGGPLQASDPVTVLATGDGKNPTLYANQTLKAVPTNLAAGSTVATGHTDEDGYSYLQVRDGVKLSVNVRLPDPNFYGPGPYPTVIQYSGYAPSKPGVPDGPDAGGLLANDFGFAYVGVNVRGSGCAGGVFDPFNAAEAADGYDVVETVAHQPWVKNGKVGMMGISFSGITQLYVAATQPPHLAGITPLSVIEDPWYEQWPGGIYNSGFTQQWLAKRDDEAAGGAQWVKDRIANGDTTCSSNLTIRSQQIPFEAFAKSLERRPLDADRRNLSLIVPNITAPTFLAGAWQDEQTGSRFGYMLDKFTSVPAGQKKFELYNGHHPDGFSPMVMMRWFEFLSFYVDHTTPKLNSLVRAFGATQLESIFGVPGLGFEPDRFIQSDGVTPVGGSYDTALAAYQAESPVRTLWEVGASPNFTAYPGAQQQRFDMNFPSWPPPDATPHTFYFGANGSLTEAGNGPIPNGSAVTGVDRFNYDPTVVGTDYNVSGDMGNIHYVNDWKATADGKGLAYETPPLQQDMIVAGEGYANLWFRSSGTDTPLEVVLSEVYAQPDPNGKQEVRVQDGLLRPGYRTLDPTRGAGTRIDEKFYAQDYHPLTPGQWVNVKVPLYSVAHPFRAGSRLRVEINTAGGDSALWNFQSPDYGTTTNDVAWGGDTASSLVLPMLPAGDPNRSIPQQFDTQAARPPCDALRGQPCRVYHHLANQTLTPTIGDYVPVPPERLLETRNLPQIGYSGPKPAAGDTVQLQVTGVGDANIPADAKAVVLNVTGTDATADGHVTVWPCGAPRPLASNLNLVAGGTRPNLVVSGVGTGGKVCLYTNAGTQLIADVMGWYPATSSLNPVTPERLLDTRDGSQVGYTGSKPTPGQIVELDVTGVGAANVPDDAKAVVLNVTGVGPSEDGYVTVWPCGSPQPLTSNLNVRAGEINANLVVVGVGAAGKVCLYTKGGAHLVADIDGWLPAGSPYTSVEPERLLETRPLPTVGYNGPKPAPGQTIELDVTGVGNTNIPDDASAVVLNVTGTNATGDGYVTVWPCGSPKPLASNLNLNTDDTKPNLVISGIGANGRVCLYTKAGTHLVADVSGYYPHG